MVARFRLLLSIAMVVFVSSARPALGQGGTIVYVNQAAPAGGNGQTWATAYNDLQAAITGAASISGRVQFWIAAGTYRPAPPGGSTSANFSVAPLHSFHGGFAGTESDLSQRDLSLHTTVLSGDLNGDDVGELNQNDNTRLAILDGVSGGSTVSDVSEFTGLTITGGIGTSPTAGASALRLTASSGFPPGGGGNRRISIRDCRIVGNRSSGNVSVVSLSNYNGDGVSSNCEIERCEFVNSSISSTGAGVLFSNCAAIVRESVFRNNVRPSAFTFGGGAAARVVSSGKRVLFHACTFERNSSPSGGAVAVAESATAGFYNCRFLGNSSNSGGAINGFKAGIVLVNCIFAGNVGTSGAGALFNQMRDSGGGSGVTSIYHCTIAGNQSGGPSGELAAAVGLVGDGSTPSSITNCLLWRNTATNAAGLAAQINHSTAFGGGPPVLTACSIEGFVVGYGGAGSARNDALDPQFFRAVSAGPDLAFGTVDDDYGDLRPRLGSPSTDSGDNLITAKDDVDMNGDGDTGSRIPFDIERLPRYSDDPATVDTGVGIAPIVDRGAYETPVNCPTCPGVRNWRRPPGGNWDTFEFWNPSLPMTDSDTRFGLTATYAVTFDPPGVPGTGAASRSVRSMTIAAGSVTFDLNQTSLNLESIDSQSLTIGESATANATGVVTDGVISAVYARIAPALTTLSPLTTHTLQVGTGGDLRVSRSLLIGAAGRGRMLVSSGGHVTSRDATIGDQPGSNGYVSVSGPGSMWDIPFFCIIDNGELNVTSQGTVNVGTGIPFTGIFLLNDGRVSGDGTINGNVVNFGRVSPVNGFGGPGTLTINGGYAQVGEIQDLGAFSGRLEIDVAGATAGQFDKLIVNPASTGAPAVTLGGGMFVSFQPGFQPAPADSFRILDAGTSPIDSQFDVIFFPRLTAAPVQGKFMRANYTGLRGPGGNGITIGLADLPPGAGFQPPQSTNLADAPAGAALGDLDRDGDLDLAVALPNGAATGAIAILFNDGAGSFSTTQISSGGIDPRAVAIANMDNANGNDLVIANTGSDEVRILRQQAVAGNFSSPIVISLPAGSAPVAVAAADLDFANPANMGVDLAIANGEPTHERGSISVSRNLGGGNFATARLPSPLPMTHPLDIRPVNPIQDKDLDLCTTMTDAPDGSIGTQGTIAIYANVGGTGIFGTSVPTAIVTTGAHPVQLVAGRLGLGEASGPPSGVGGDDLVTVNRGDASQGGQSVSVLRNDGSFDENNPSASPGYAPSVEYPIVFDGSTVPSDPSSIALADLDDDGDFDIAVAGAVSAAVRKVKILRNDSTAPGAAQPVRQLAFAPQADAASGDCPVRVLAGDISGDGRRDLVTINASCNRGQPGSVNTALNTLPPLSLSLGACCSPPSGGGGGSCTVTTIGACTLLGNNYHGELTTCAPNPCPQPVAACCRGAICLSLDSTACTGSPNSRYAGAGTTCNAPGNRISPCCNADFNQNGVRSVQDIFDFLAAYFSGTDPSVDINRSMTTSVQDIFDFLAAYFAGCS